MRRLSQLSLLVEAGAALLAACVCVRFVPFRCWAGTLGRLDQPPAAAPNKAQLAQARAVAWALRAWRRRLPGRPTCLMQAAAGQWLLRRRGISAAVYLGVRRAAGESSPRYEAHAWLRCGSLMVTGGDAAPDFLPLTSFSSEE